MKTLAFLCLLACAVCVRCIPTAPTVWAAWLAVLFAGLTALCLAGACIEHSLNTKA